ASAAFKSPFSSDANGSLLFHSGCRGASAFTRSIAKRTWKYIGCSAQSVPSWSKAATRSAGGTKAGPPSLVPFPTNSTIACFAFPSLHEASGSAARTPAARIDAAATTAATAVRTWRPTRLVGPAVGGLRLLHRLVDRRTADESPCGSGAKREQSGRRH